MFLLKRSPTATWGFNVYTCAASRLHFCPQAERHLLHVGPQSAKQNQKRLQPNLGIYVVLPVGHTQDKIS